MKKIIIVLTTMFSIFFLVACDNIVSIGLEVKEAKEGFTEITFTMSWDENQDKVIKDSVYAVALKDNKEVSRKEGIKSNTEFKVINLEKNTEYNIVLYGTSKTNIVKLYEKKYITLKEGSSTENPVLLSTKEDIIKLRQLMLSTKNEDIKERDVLLEAYFKLGQDIDFNGEVLEGPIFGSRTFKGTFDGSNHTIKNISIKNSSSSHTAFLGRVSGTVKDVVFSNIVIDNLEKSYSATNYIGIVASQADTSAKFSNIEVKDSKIKQKHQSQYSQLSIGAIVGQARGTYSDLKVTNLSIEAVVGNENDNNYTLRTNINIGSILGLYDDTNKNINARINQISAINSNISLSYKDGEAETTDRNSINVGGLIGDLGRLGTQRDFHYEGDIKIIQTKYKKAETSDANKKYGDRITLNVGGATGSSLSPIKNLYVTTNISVEQSESKEVQGLIKANIGMISGSSYEIVNGISTGSINLKTTALDKDIKVEIIGDITRGSNNHFYKEAILKVNDTIQDNQTNVIQTKEELSTKGLSDWILEKIK